MPTRTLEGSSQVCTRGISGGHLVRAVMEGVVFALRDSLELMRRLGVDASEAVAVGGGARSAFWRQMQADVLGVPVVTMEPSGGAPYGAAMLASVGTGRFAPVKEGVPGLASAPRLHRAQREDRRRIWRSLRALPEALSTAEGPLRRAVAGRVTLSEWKESVACRMLMEEEAEREEPTTGTQK